MLLSNHLNGFIFILPLSLSLSPPVLSVISHFLLYCLRETFDTVICYLLKCVFEICLFQSLQYHHLHTCFVCVCVSATLAQIGQITPWPKHRLRWWRGVVIVESFSAYILPSYLEGWLIVYPTVGKENVYVYSPFPRLMLWLPFWELCPWRLNSSINARYK